jgi:hypothetical protein
MDKQQMYYGWPYDSYSVEVRDQWSQGKGGTYTGNDKMRRDLAASSTIKGKIKDLIEPDILAAGSDLPCFDVEEAHTSIVFGSDVSDPVKFTSGELQATARKPDRVTCQVSIAYAKTCDPDPKAACCPCIEYIALASCRLQDTYDWHNPRNEDGTIIKEYENTTPRQQHGLDVMWSHQQRLKRQGKPGQVLIDIAFQVDLDGELCVP